MPAISLSSTAQAVLASAAESADHVVTLPDRLPIAAQRAVVKSMLATGVIEEVPSEAGQPVWRTSEAGDPMVLRATQAGLVALAKAQDVAGPNRPTEADCAGTDGADEQPPVIDRNAPLSPRVRLRAAAEAVMTAWDETDHKRLGLSGAIDALRAALAATTRTSTASDTPRAPRAGIKQQTVLALLRRPEGATVAQVAEVTGWAQHTVRGFFAGLKKRGITVTVLERVRQVGSGKQGAKGSYTVYRVGEAG